MTVGQIKQGNGYRIPVTVQQRNVDGTLTLVTPTTITGTLLLPDQTTTSFTPTADSLGQYHADLAPVTINPLGPYQWKVVTTGPGAAEFDGSFVVVDPFESELISLEDAKQALNKSFSVTADDDEVRLYIDAVTEAVEDYLGPVGRRSVTDVREPCGGVLLLTTTPVVSLTSVTPYLGVALSVGVLDLSMLTAGVIKPGIYSAGFYAPQYTIVYVAGRASIPGAVQLAAREILCAAWEATQRGTGAGTGRIIGAVDVNAEVGAVAFSYLKSYGVRELLDSAGRRPPGIA